MALEYRDVSGRPWSWLTGVSLVHGVWHAGGGGGSGSFHFTSPPEVSVKRPTLFLAGCGSFWGGVIHSDPTGVVSKVRLLSGETILDEDAVVNRIALFILPESNPGEFQGWTVELYDSDGELVGRNPAP